MMRQLEEEIAFRTRLTGLRETGVMTRGRRQ